MDSDGVDPAHALRPGRWDPTALLVVWLLRRSSLPLLVVGVVVAVLILGSEQPQPEFDTWQDALGLLLSPWAGVALAFIVRVVANTLALVLTLPLTSRARPGAYEGLAATRWTRAALDRLRMARAWRELRWTSLVRELAASRLGTPGRRLRLVDRVITIGTPVAVVVIIVVASWLRAS